MKSPPASVVGMYPHFGSVDGGPHCGSVGCSLWVGRAGEGGGSHCESVGGGELLISGRWGGVRVYACMFVVFLYSVAIEVEAHKSVVRLAQMNSSPENCDFAAIM